jgi:ABC-2 type transport system permease protein
MPSLRRLWAVARKESLHVLRDWRSLVLALAIPLVLILLFGYALSLDLRNVPTVVWDQSRSPQSRDLISFFNGSPYFAVEDFHDNYRDLERDLNRGAAMIALVIPSDFAKALASGQAAPIQVLVDGSDANSGRLAMGYTRALGLLYNQHLLELRGGEQKAAVELAPRVLYNQDLRSQNAIIPGIIALVMVVIAAMLTSVTVAREWETGTMEQLISTPIRVPELVLGKVVPYFVIGMADLFLAVGLGKWLFAVPLRGSTGLLFLAASIFLLGALFFGLMLSITVKSQILANQFAIFASYLPTLLLSGFVFSIENMPPWLQGITYIVPARYFIAILKGIYLKGIGLEVLWLNLLFLSLYAAIMVAVAHKRMKLKLE